MKGEIEAIEAQLATITSAGHASGIQVKRDSPYAVTVDPYSLSAEDASAASSAAAAPASSSSSADVVASPTVAAAAARPVKFTRKDENLRAQLQAALRHGDEA